MLRKSNAEEEEEEEKMTHSHRLSVVLAGGGTAGHVNPLIATALALREQVPGADITAVGTTSGLETALVPAAGFALDMIPRVPLPRHLNKDLVMLPKSFLSAVRAAQDVLRSRDADVLVGFGGYVSTPMYYAAHKLGIPFIVHEGNARPGLANKIGARWANVVALTFASTKLHAHKGETLSIGLPLKSSVTALAQRDVRERLRTEAIAEWGFDPQKKTLLVTGGSSGALHINEVVSASSELLVRAGIQVLHITGKGKDEPVRDIARSYPEGSYVVLDYLNDMSKAYAVADAIITRAGAGMVAEVSALGIPAVFVPLPIGNGEQALNAQDVVRGGGALMVRNEEFSESWVNEHVVPLMDDAVLTRMRSRAQAVSSIDAAHNLASIITEVAR
ncbi:MAG: undecaprenyldiphospho-muramoylpentapeptide beta-N-acetylglucosaminyltransferase [Actinomycetaceae bacterium]|nr:undecaprenyldiphospho-muramoylpentapeptide beta-N-acetylglucosaminyltransferase [Arcanobacterium sp.]MDD7505423.1 undecaprenyldiphospho-muramoylpentapeptide beta-N-acetylglucosaminyltransferase [Actinomycetaceae bacterium]MDY6142768.1 undecaprenyldiphospho-muramoylpentapeptide beta-N-acetylglucosaminyltransferase [Arcanobacterium sp.]